MNSIKKRNKIFEDIVGSIKTEIQSSDEELREAHNQFSKKWARKL